MPLIHIVPFFLRIYASYITKYNITIIMETINCHLIGKELRIVNTLDKCKEIKIMLRGICLIHMVHFLQCNVSFSPHVFSVLA